MRKTPLPTASTAEPVVEGDSPELGATAVAEHTESREARAHRISTGALVAVVGLALLGLLTSTHGTARFALSDAFAAVKLPTLAVPGIPVVLVCGVLCLLAGAGFISGRMAGRLPAIAGTLAAVATVVGFLAWAAAGRGLPFPVSNQFAGTFLNATPLVLGALCGVMCERAGVVNVAIEGQMLTAAFAAALTGSITQSITAALVAGMVAGVLMAVLLALFSIKYLVDQVVLGVVLNLFASGLTGFVFDQLVQPNADRYNNAPIMQKIAIPGLAKIPFFGPILFDQTILAYIAVLCIGVAWYLLYRTKWGLRVRAVGEHPKAADTVGISVTRVRWQAVLVGGVFAGLAGSYFTIGSVGQFDKDLTAGNGFIALAAVIMGRWRPGLASLMAIMFGFVVQMSSQLQTINTPLPSQFMLILPYVATIIAVAGLVGAVRSPAADGVPYVKEGH